jgi:Pathogenicity locus
MAKRTAKNPLENIPGVGKAIAQDLNSLNIYAVQDLVNQDPEGLYQRLCVLQGRHIDRCMLYVFRCAIYYASTAQPEPELLKWWNWKDQPNHHLATTSG